MMSETSTNLSGPCVRRDVYVGMALLMALAFLLYANTFGNAWTYDDYPVILENPDIRSLQAFLSDSYPGRPLREITFLLDHALFGLNPFGYHFQNIFWHGLNAGLLFLAVLRLGGSKTAGGLASLLFLVHPVQVEVAANISHRKDSLALAFCLLSFLAYAQACVPSRKKFFWLSASLALAYVALLAKQTAVVLPIIFLAYEAALVPRSRRFLLRWKWNAPVLLGGGAVAASLYAFRMVTGDTYGEMLARHLARQNYFAGDFLSAHYLMAMKSWVFMFAKLIFPLDLAVEYTYPVPTSWLDPWIVAAALGVGLYLFGLFASFRRWPLVFFGLIWMGAFWLPTSNLLPYSYYAADRYLYSPSAGFFMMAAFAGERLAGRRSAVWGAGLALAALLSVPTWQQNRVWRSPETLWTHAYSVNPQSAYALNNMGMIHLEKGDQATALRYFQESVATNPTNPTAQFNLGWIYERRGEREKALEYYRRFLSINDPLFASQARSLRQRLARQYGLSLD